MSTIPQSESSAIGNTLMNRNLLGVLNSDKRFFMGAASLDEVAAIGFTVEQLTDLYVAGNPEGSSRPLSWFQHFENLVIEGFFSELPAISDDDLEDARTRYFAERRKREYDAYVADQILVERGRREARRNVDLEEASAKWSPPEDEDVQGSLADQLAQERVIEPQLIDGLIGAHHNLSLTGQYKTGKTTFALNCVRALVDSEEFLGRKTALADEKTVQWWNMEMDRDDWEEYVQPVGIGRLDRIIPKHLRGRPVPILTDLGFEWTVEALKAANTGVWWIDSWRVLCSWNGVNENDNTGGGLLTQRLDEIKVAAGVDVIGLLVHTGRMVHEEGEERARGMTALDDWVDARWVLTRKHETRYFAASGRRIKWEGTGTALVFDAQTNRTILGTGDRKQSHESEIYGYLFAYVTEHGETNTRQLIAALRSSGLVTSQNKALEEIAGAYASGVLNQRQDGRSLLYGPGTPYQDILARRLEWANQLKADN